MTDVIREPDGKFAPGQSACPGGSVPGKTKKSQQFHTQYRKKIDKNVPKVFDIVIARALAAEYEFCKLFLDKVYKNPRYDFVKFDIVGQLETIKDTVDSSAALIGEISKGNINPDEGRVIMSILESHFKMLQGLSLDEVEKRLQSLEEAINAGA